MERLKNNKLIRSNTCTSLAVPTPSSPINDSSKSKDLIPILTPTCSVSHIKQKKTLLPKPRMVEVRAPDVPMVVETKKKIDELTTLIRKICTENESTPEIEEEFRPALAAVQNSLPEFYNQSINYFVTLKKMKDSAKQNMILSSAIVRKPLAQFSHDWLFYSETIERLCNEKPSPHGKHITMNFVLISHTLDNILQQNNKRTHPCSTLYKTVYSIQSLCDNLSQSIVSLFSQPTFPNFQTDLLSTYKHDVKAFLRILTKAFTSEFPKSGIQIYDLSCIKSDVFSQVNEILSSLESAFTFQSVLENAVKMKDEISKTLTIIFDQLSIEFNIIKPNPEVVAQLEKEKQEKAQSSRTITPKKPFKKQIELDPVTQFVQNVSPKLSVEVFKDNKKNLLLIQEKILSLLKTIENQNAEIIKLKGQINQMDDYQELYRTQSVTYGSLIDQTKTEIQTKEDRIKGFDNQIDDLKNQINKKNEQIWSIQCQVSDIRDILANKLGKPIMDESPQSAISTMKAMLNSIQSIKEMANLLQSNENDRKDLIDFLKETIKYKNEDQEETMINIAEKTKKYIQNKREKNHNFKIQLESQQKSYDEKIKKLIADVENEQIESAANIELEKEKHEEDLTEIKKKLISIISEDDKNESANFSSVEDAISAISKVFCTLKDEINKRDEIIDKRSRKKKELKSKIIESYSFPDSWSFKIIVNTLIQTKNDLRNIPEDLKKLMKKLREDIKTLYLRLLGLAHLDLVTSPSTSTSSESSTNEFDAELTMDNIFRLIDNLQDERDRLTHDCSLMTKMANQLRNCFITLEQRLCLYLGQKKIDPKITSNEDLMERIHLFVDNILDPDFNSQYMKVNNIRSYFRTLGVSEAASPTEYIPAFCNVFDIMEQSLDVLPQFSQSLKTINDAFIVGQPSFLKPGDSDFILLAEQTEMMWSYIGHIKENSIDQNLHFVLTKFVWLTHELVNQLSKKKIT